MLAYLSRAESWSFSFLRVPPDLEPLTLP